MDPHAVVFVEGVSDRIAVEALAQRRGRDLAAEGILVLPAGGAQAIGRFLDDYGPRGANTELAGLCDEGEEPQLRRALEQAGFGSIPGRGELERLGFYVCERDLEEELVRALGGRAVEQVLAAHGKLRSFRTYQKQPAHRGRATEDQLRGFLNNWKIELAGPLVEALEADRIPRPLDGLLGHI
jgi:Overcoming lysogenization defect protein-like, TOPRIM domain